MEVPNLPTALQPASAKHGRKFFTIIILSLVLVCVIAWLGWKWFDGKKSGNQENVTQPQSYQPRITLGVKRTEVDTKQLPEGMPQSLPNENGARITQNYFARAENGETQSVREYETSRSVEENTALFKEFFKKDGWELTADITPASGLRMLNAVKDQKYLTITLGGNSVTNRRTVRILLTPLVTK